MVRAFVTMMPRLDAGEQLAAVRVAALGGGHMEKDARREAMNDLKRRADAGRPRPRAKAASASDLAAMGIGMKVVPASSSEAVGPDTDVPAKGNSDG